MFIKKEQSHGNNNNNNNNNINDNNDDNNNINNNKNNNSNNNNDNNLEKSYTQKKAKHEPSGWAMLTGCSFDKKENKLNYYRGKDCIEKLCKKLKECAIKRISYEKKGNDTIN